jgi:predicted site-specific integrase-resolvase
MNDVTSTIVSIQRAVKDMGLAAFSRAAGVPYTTLVHWDQNGYRPKVISTFEKLAVAAERHEQQVQDSPQRRARTA